MTVERERFLFILFFFYDEKHLKVILYNRLNVMADNLVHDV